MARTATEEARQQAYETLSEYYSQAAPIIERVSDLNTFNYGELPLNPYMLVEAGITLKMMRHALKKIPEPRDKELSAIRRQFDTALANCVKAAEATEKYVEVAGTSRSPAILNIIINSTVMANEYMGSVSKKLKAYNIRSDDSAAAQVKKQAPVAEKVERKEAEKIISAINADIESYCNNVNGQPQASPGKKPDGIIHALDKIGDIIIYPIVKIADLSDSIHKAEDTDKK
jgi:hypothetical protein